MLVVHVRSIEGTWTAPKSRNTAEGVGPQPSDTYTHMHIHTTHNVIHVHARLADLVHTSIVDTASLQ